MDFFTVPAVLVMLYLDLDAGAAFFAVLDAAGLAPPKEKRGLEATGFFATGFFAAGFATGFVAAGFTMGFTAAFFTPGAAGFFLPKSASVGCDRGERGRQRTSVECTFPDIFGKFPRASSRGAR